MQWNPRRNRAHDPSRPNRNPRLKSFFFNSPPILTHRNPSRSYDLSPSMENQRPVRCSENEEVALYLWTKRQEMASANGISENLDLTLSNAYRSICSAKTPIKTLKDLSQIKGVGKWILRLMQGFFPSAEAEASPSKDAAQIGKKVKGAKHYVPKKNTVAYAFLITLYRGIANGTSFMKKQELIDATEASGLSRTSVMPDKTKMRPGQFASSPRDWYTGWNCMKPLISKGLVAKSSCPAKYMLTHEGEDVARECLLRSGLADSAEPSIIAGGSQSYLEGQNGSLLDISRVVSSGNGRTLQSADVSCRLKIDDINKNLECGQIHSSDSELEELHEKDFPAILAACTSNSRRMCSTDSINERDYRTNFNPGGAPQSRVSVSTDSALCSFGLRACSSSDLHVHKSLPVNNMDHHANTLAMPPHRFGEKFEDIYDVILVLDDRENFGSRKRKVVDNIHSQSKVLVEVRRLPVGDGIWIVKHRQYNTEYVLDFIVERKNVDDLCSSIRDNRYRDQKLRMQRCGLQKLIYLVEGDPNSLESAETIKTACFTTEIMEGFDVQRTTGFADTMRKYGYLTQSISEYYRTHFPSYEKGSARICFSFDEFVKRCQDLEKMTVSDVFALQLMQVPQVTEEIALAVVDLYPTLQSLARAYFRLEGSVRAQEEMLKDQCQTISGPASKNIFKLVWGS